jgi:AAA family ATP:ADP antiporter
MTNFLIYYFYPSIDQKDRTKFSYLASIFFTIIGTYWLFALLKNIIFIKIAFPESLGWPAQQGRLVQPMAQAITPIITFVMMLIYSKLVDICKKHQLFYIICSFYAAVFSALTFFLWLNETQGAECIGCFYLAAIGWVSYFAVDTFGLLVPALFWSFTNSITDSTAAKKGFPLIIAMAQIGAITGSSALFFSNHVGTLWPLFGVGTMLVACLIPMIAYFMRTIPPEQLIGNKAAHETEFNQEGFIEGLISGLKLIFSRGYIFGIFIISTFFEAVSQIVDYQMQSYAAASPLFSSTIAFARFQGLYGMSINFLSLIIALWGTAYVIQKIGTRISIMIYPLSFVIILGFILLYSLHAPYSPTILWVTFFGMIIIKGIGYAINSPTKEIMYIPTSKDAKFKSRGFIDTLGTRIARAGGAQVGNAFKHDLNDLMIYGTLIGCGLVSVWLIAAFYVGKKNSQLVKKGIIIH